MVLVCMHGGVLPCSSHKNSTPKHESGDEKGVTEIFYLVLHAHCWHLSERAAEILRVMREPTEISNQTPRHPGITEYKLHDSVHITFYFVLHT